MDIHSQLIPCQCLCMFLHMLNTDIGVNIFKIQCKILSPTILNNISKNWTLKSPKLIPNVLKKLFFVCELKIISFLVEYTWMKSNHYKQYA